VFVLSREFVMKLLEIEAVSTWPMSADAELKLFVAPLGRAAVKE
jgi:hypothetical protein